jgi:hypothetical protein
MSIRGAKLAEWVFEAADRKRVSVTFDTFKRWGTTASLRRLARSLLAGRSADAGPGFAYVTLASGKVEVIVRDRYGGNVSCESLLGRGELEAWAYLLLHPEIPDEPVGPSEEWAMWNLRRRHQASLLAGALSRVHASAVSSLREVAATIGVHFNHEEFTA